MSELDSARDSQIDEARKYTYDLMDKFSEAIKEFLASENGFKHNDKLLIVTRAVNGHAVYWGQNLFRRLEDIEDLAKKLNEQAQ